MCNFILLHLTLHSKISASVYVSNTFVHSLGGTLVYQIVAWPK